LKVCVTGGAGFIGRQLVNSLEAAGADLILLSRSPKKDKANTQYFLGDLADQSVTLEGLLDDVSVIYHCAGEIKNDALMRALHVDGTSRLLREVDRVIKSTNRNIHWVQLSSVGAYGMPAGVAHEVREITEATPTAPQGEYETTKTISDELVMEYAKIEPLFSYSILRPSNVIGPSMTNQSLRSLVNVIRNGRFFYIGSRTSIATYIHVNDVAAALILCGNDERAEGQVFNLSNDCALSEIVNAVALSVPIPPPRLCVPEWSLRMIAQFMSRKACFPLTQARIDALVRHTSYPLTKIKTTMGFVPHYSIPREVTTMFEQN
jgi:nucleoside-diphosphate-sugar epimerase